VIDEGGAFVDAAQRYKVGWWHDGGLKVEASPDGLAWKQLGSGVVLKHNHDINGIWRDHPRQRYIAIASVYTEDPQWIGKRRITFQSDSQDLITWSEPWNILRPDERDEGETQFYAMDGFLQRGDLLIGMVKVLRDDLKARRTRRTLTASGIRRSPGRAMARPGRATVKSFLIAIRSAAPGTHRWVRQNEWKLIDPVSAGHAELYDIANDPFEKRNLASENPEKVQTLTCLLDEWWNARRTN